MTEKSSSMVLSGSYDLLKRKHMTSKYIGVNILNFVSVKKYKQILTSLFNWLPENSDIIFEHGFTPYDFNPTTKNYSRE